MENIFTTDVIEPAQRTAFWQKFVCDHIADLNCHIPNHTNFRGKIVSYPLGSLSLAIITADPHEVFRDCDRIRHRRNDYFLFLYQKSGLADYEQNNMVSRLEPGDFVLYDPRLPYRMSLLENFEHITITLPRHLLASLEIDLTEIIGRPLRQSSPAGSVVSSMIKSLAQQFEKLNTEALMGFVESAIPVIVHAFLAEFGHQGREYGPSSSYRTLARAKSYIACNLSDFDLSVNRVADHANVSARHLNRLFKSEGTTPAKWMKSLRLERCASALVHPINKNKTITEIAHDFGISDVSHFCKDFRHTFGYSPGAYGKTFQAKDKQILRKRAQV